MRALRGLALVLPLLATAACGNTVYINDSIDLDWDFQITKPSVDSDLHTPYVLGAKVDITVSDSDDDVDLSGWRVVSVDPHVFRVDSMTAGAHTVGIRGFANASGSTEIVVFDGDHERARTTVEVVAPDRVELDAHAWMIIGRPEQAPVDEVRVKENGTATYLVRYFKGDRELYGNGTLTLLPPDGLQATPIQTFLFEDREWLQVFATTPGDVQLQVGAAGVLIDTVPVHVVPEGDIDRIEIHGMDESGARKDDWLVAAAQAYDAQDRRVFGVDYSWTVDDYHAEGLGDLYRYEYKPGATVLLGAHQGDMVATANLHVGEGFVDSSNGVGCSIAAPGGRRTRAAGGLGVLALGAVLATRRRRRRAAAQDSSPGAR